MRNEDVIKSFIHKVEAISYNGNLRSTGDRLFSYNTCIAEHLDNGDTAINITKYSNTTSRHQNMLKQKMYTTLQVINVPINTQQLYGIRRCNELQHWELEL